MKFNDKTFLKEKNKILMFYPYISSKSSKNINKTIKRTEDFNILWRRLIKIKQLYVSNILPEKWFTVDNNENYQKLKKM